MATATWSDPLIQWSDPACTWNGTFTPATTDQGDDDQRPVFRWLDRPPLVSVTARIRLVPKVRVKVEVHEPPLIRVRAKVTVQHPEWLEVTARVKLPVKMRAQVEHNEAEVVERFNRLLELAMESMA